VRNGYINCLIDFSEQGELIEDMELLMHLADHTWTHLHQLPQRKVLKFSLLLLAETIGRELQLLLEDSNRFLRLVQQFLNILLHLTAILILEITNVLQFLQ